MQERGYEILWVLIGVFSGGWADVIHENCRADFPEKNWECCKLDSFIRYNLLGCRYEW